MTAADHFFVKLSKMLSCHCLDDSFMLSTLLFAEITFLRMMRYDTLASLMWGWHCCSRDLVTTSVTPDSFWHLASSCSRSAFDGFPCAAKSATLICCHLRARLDAAAVDVASVADDVGSFTVWVTQHSFYSITVSTAVNLQLSPQWIHLWYSRICAEKGR